MAKIYYISVIVALSLGSAGSSFAHPQTEEAATSPSVQDSAPKTQPQAKTKTWRSHRHHRHKKPLRDLHIPSSTPVKGGITPMSAAPFAAPTSTVTPMSASPLAAPVVPRLSTPVVPQPIIIPQRVITTPSPGIVRPFNQPHSRHGHAAAVPAPSGTQAGTPPPTTAPATQASP